MKTEQKHELRTKKNDARMPLKSLGTLVAEPLHRKKGGVPLRTHSVPNCASSGPGMD
jgi:hypothetical protein